MLDGVDFLEIEPAHGVQSLIGGSLLDRNILLDENLFLRRQTIWLSIRHVDDRMGLPVVITKTGLGNALAIIRVNRPVG